MWAEMSEHLKNVSHFEFDLLLDPLACYGNNSVLYYLRGLHGVIVLCHHMRLQNHIAVIFTSVEMGGIMAVAIFCFQHRITILTMGSSLK